ncbi:MAG TPA: DUF2939 domain-containing protein [Acetobacteraceae bacterium]|nr:DUF2939 domain-containing protein [Acetobacteraceae bacterium]
MFAAKPILAAVFAVGVGYAASPYVTLYRLDHAMRTGDSATLQRLVDWPAVREGIKEDICDGLADDSAQAMDHGQLPPFGASFVQGIAANAVDRAVTPEALADFTRHDGRVQSVTADVTWAFFDDPTDFVVTLHVPGQQGPVRLEMTLKDARWQVTRIWLTPSLLQEANART